MKFLSALAFAGLASAATLKVKRDDIDATGELSLPDLSFQSELVLNENEKIYAAGAEEGTNVTMFQFPDGQFYGLEFGPGPAVEGLTVGSNGVCKNCRADAGTSIASRSLDDELELVERADDDAGLEKRFFFLHLIGGLVKFKLNLLGGITKTLFAGCFKGYYRPIRVRHPHGHWGQCSVGPHGYIHWPNVYIGCSNGIGGHYVGCSQQGTQLWQWENGSICPMHVRRGRCRVGWRPRRRVTWWKREEDLE